MAEYFVQEGASGSKDGRDPNGFDLTAGSYDDTGHGDGNYRLSSTGSFSSYTFGEDDWIYLSGGAGITPGLYEIASKVSNDVILLTSSAGSDSTSDVTSSDGPMTMEEACSVPPAAGDTVWIKADATYNTKDSVGSAIMYLKAGGVVGNLTTYEGYKTNPGDGGIVKMDANPASQYQYCIYGLSGYSYIHYRNFELTGASVDGLSTRGGDRVHVENCSSHDNGSAGFRIDDYSAISRCIAYDNDGPGIVIDWQAQVIACIAYGNGGIGIDHRGYNTIYCLSYENTGTQIVNDDLTTSTVIACTVDGGGTQKGIIMDGYNSIICNNIIYDCTTPMEYVTASRWGNELQSFGRNCYKDNDSGNTNMDAVEAGNGIGNRGDVSEPTNLFTNAATNDYTLHASSGAKNKGIDANFTLNFWNDYNEGAGNNPPSE